VAVRAVKKPLSAEERRVMHRVQAAKKAEPKWDVHGEYAAKCGELAREVGREPHEVYDEFCERSAARVIVGGLDVETGERLAYEDCLERFRVKL
jgi:hypothetical protein